MKAHIKTYLDYFIEKILIRILIYISKRGYDVQIETTPFKNKEFEKYIKGNQFVQKHNGTWQKGFVFVKLLDDVIEIKTISEIENTKTIRISSNKLAIEQYLKYLNKLL